MPRALPSPAPQGNTRSTFAGARVGLVHLSLKLGNAPETEWGFACTPSPQLARELRDQLDAAALAAETGISKADAADDPRGAIAQRGDRAEERPHGTGRADALDGGRGVAEATASVRTAPQPVHSATTRSEHSADTKTES